MSWNTVNRFPHHTFWWEGIDGSRVLTHFPSVDTYNSALTGPELAHAARNLADPDVLDASIAPFGYGDGGGGPTREMMRRARLTADLEGSPRVAVASPERFFDAVDDAIADGADPAVWLGEMYLEGCRGTFTSQARTKEGHRRVERLLLEAELWATQAAVRRGADYPAAALASAWQELLLMEFHDVLPGSSIAWVHQDAERRLAATASRLETLIADTLAAFAEDGAAEVVANAAAFPQRGVAGHAIARAGEPSAPVVVESGDGLVVLRNGMLDVVVDERDGAVVSVVDGRTGRELLDAGGRANLPTLHRDAPARWDAWDIDISIDVAVEHLDAVEALGVERHDDGTATVVVSRTFGSSSLTQRISLHPDDDHVELETEVDWHERERLLKLEFPLAVTTDRWQAETQFGIVERPTHRNTSWDEARFEACAHRWVRVGEPGFGVALVNERTYGHDARRIARAEGAGGTMVRASLLRAPRYPDPEADQGRHVFRFALVAAPDPVDAVRVAAGFASGGRRLQAAPVAPLATSSAAGVVVSAVKLAEDGSGDVIVRIHEARGARTRSALQLGFASASVGETDILERPLDDRPDPDLDDLELAPFQVRTFRVVRA
jgi:alpha-mannosidase